MRAACHCTAVRLETDAAPQGVNDCNCTLCRRYGVLWFYIAPPHARLVAGEEALEAYIWGDRELGFWFCRACGCVTHHSYPADDPHAIRGVNARMIQGLDPATVRIRRTDNAHTGFFWTREDRPITPGGQPPMAPPGADDWR